MRVLFLIPKSNPPDLQGNYTKLFKEFVALCLNKDPKNVSTPARHDTRPALVSVVPCCLLHVHVCRNPFPNCVHSNSFITARYFSVKHLGNRSDSRMLLEKVIVLVFMSSKHNRGLLRV